MEKRRVIGVVAVGLAVVAGLAGLASAASKPPKFGGCVTGDTNATKPSLGLGGTGNCTGIPTAVADGFGSGMASNIALAASADGKSVYTVSYSDDAIAELKRNKKTGKLTYQGCISGDDQLGSGGGSGACELIPSHTLGGAASGLDGPRGVVVSADGKSVYVAAGAQEDASVATFKRSKDTGKLSYKGCISGNSDLGGGGGSGACDLIPTATPGGGASSGLSEPRDLIVSKDGKSVYGVTREDASVFHLKRASDGKLTWKDCVTGSTQVKQAHACKPLPVTFLNGGGTGLYRPEYALLSPDQKNVYVSAEGDDAISTFKRGRDTGRLRFQRCVSGSSSLGSNSGSGACKLTSAHTSIGVDSGLESPYQLAISSDGKSLYVAVNGDAAVSTFKRSTKTGKIAFDRCISGDADVAACSSTPGATTGGGQASGFWGLAGIAIKGSHVLALGGSDDAVASFTRSKKSGRLTYRGCLSGDLTVGPAGSGACKLTPHAGQNSGLQAGTQLAVGGSDFYVSAAGNDAVTRITP
jgi:DNA-binding beta-propeller fold protein YncE